MNASPALLSRPLDWKFAPSNLLYWADGFDGYRYRIAAEGDSMDGTVHTTFLKMGVPDEGGETVEDVVVKRYANADAAMVEAQRHQDQQLLAWLHPQAQAQLRIAPAEHVPVPEAAEGVVAKRRSADRTWSMPEMIDRLQRALSQVVNTGDALVPCLQGPAMDAPDRPEYDRAVKDYIEHFRHNAFTHERVAALAAYLGPMHPLAEGTESKGTAQYRVFCQEEYRLAHETYEAQRTWVRDLLHLGDHDPEVLCIVPPPADAVGSTTQLGRVVLGHDSEGYRVGLLPADPSDTVVWTMAMADRQTATEYAWRIHRATPETVIVMQEAMALNAYTAGGPRP